MLPTLPEYSSPILIGLAQVSPRWSYSQLTEMSFDSARVNGRVLIDAPATCLASHKPSTVLVFSLPFAMALHCPCGPQLPQTLAQSQQTLPQN